MLHLHAPGEEEHMATDDSIRRYNATHNVYHHSLQSHDKEYRSFCGTDVAVMGKQPAHNFKLRGPLAALALLFHKALASLACPLAFLPKDSRHQKFCTGQ